MKTLILLLITVTSYGQFLAPSLTTIYQDNDKQSGMRYGIDVKYFAIQHDKEYFFDFKQAHGGNLDSDGDLISLGFGCKTGYRLKYGAMASVYGYRYKFYEQGHDDQFAGSITISPLISYDLSKYFYIESGMSIPAFQFGGVGNSYFFSFGMRWY